MELKVSSAIVFLISASVVLLVLYFALSKYSIWVLVVLFCIGGTMVFFLFQEFDFSVAQFDWSM